MIWLSNLEITKTIWWILQEFLTDSGNTSVGLTELIIRLWTYFRQASGLHSKQTRNWDRSSKDQSNCRDASSPESQASPIILWTAQLHQQIHRPAHSYLRTSLQAATQEYIHGMDSRMWWSLPKDKKRSYKPIVPPEPGRPLLLYLSMKETSMGAGARW